MSSNWLGFSIADINIFVYSHMFLEVLLTIELKILLIKETLLQKYGFVREKKENFEVSYIESFFKS